MSRRLNPVDLSWLMLDTADTPMHVGALLVFKPPGDAGAAYTARLAEHLRHTAPAGPPWTLKLSRGLRLRARWVEEPQSDLEYHFRQSALPDGGGERELGVLVERLHSRPLDLAQPPWEVHLIENLHGGQFALYCKLHQSLMDAASLMQLLTENLRPTAAAQARPPWAATSEASARSRSVAAATAALGGLAGNALGSLRALVGAFARLYRGRDGLRAPYTAPRAALNARIGRERRFATQQYEVARLERAAAACDATLEELVLFLCGSALRRFFKEHNALPDEPLVAALPAQRVQDGADDTSLGFVALGTQHADPARRLAEVRDSVRASRRHLAALPDALVPAYSLAAAAPYLLGQLAGLGGVLPAMFNLVVASLPGPERPLYLGDARLMALYPMFPLAQRSALAISTLRYADTLNVGVCGARETLPRLQRLAVYMGLALEDLEARIAAGTFGATGDAHG